MKYNEKNLFEELVYELKWGTYANVILDQRRLSLNNLIYLIYIKYKFNLKISFLFFKRLGKKELRGSSWDGW